MSPDGAVMVLRVLVGNAIERWSYVLQGVHGVERTIGKVNVGPIEPDMWAYWAVRAERDADELLLALTMSGVREAWDVLQSGRRAA